MERALRSLLSQTYEELEILLCDNASTDRTVDICQHFAAQDSRIKFFPSEVNRGAIWNFNRAFEHGTGEYFKWAAHDDFCAPQFIEKCVQVLDEQPTVVLCHSDSDEVDPLGTLLNHLYIPQGLQHEDPIGRFEKLALEIHNCILIFGVIRSETLRKTPLMGSYVASDRILLNELTLHGPFFVIGETLFWRTEHAQTSQNSHDFWERLGWFDTEHEGKLYFPHWRLVRELLRVVRQSPLTASQRVKCFRVIARYLANPSPFWGKSTTLRDLGRDIEEAAKTVLRRTEVGARLVDLMKGVYHRRPSKGIRSGGER